MTLVNQGKNYYPILDTLRGIAIILVLLHHYFSSFQIGWVGVDLFFVLSGFLITDILIRMDLSKQNLIHFYIKRILRIIPAYYLMLSLFFLLCPFVFSDKTLNSTYTYYCSNKTWFYAFQQNWLFIKKGPPPVPYLSPTWSLAVEWQFYMIWPFIIYFATKYKCLQTTILLLILISFGTRMFIYFQHPEIVENYYYNSICRMDSLLFGSFLAVQLYHGKTISQKIQIFSAISCIALLLFCGFVYKNLDSNNILLATIGYSTIALFFMSLLYWVLSRPDRIFFSIPPLKFIGKISYGIYIYHIPIYLFVMTLLSRLQHHYSYLETVPYLAVLLSFSLTIIVSMASYYLFEKPAQQLNIALHKQIVYQINRFRLNYFNK